MENTILNLVGNTPCIKLEKINSYDCEIWLKLESCNPAGSIKDRVVAYSIKAAWEAGKLCKQSVLVEASSGNTGIALGMVAAVYGLRCIVTMPENMTVERRRLMQAYGAEVVLTPASEGMAGAVRRAEEILSTTAKAFSIDQFNNVQMVEAHYKNTGPEIYAQLGKVHALIAGVGTGGTVSGTGLFLREKIKDVQIYAVQPHESPMLSKGQAGKHGIQGIGANFIPKVLRQEILDEILSVKTDDAIIMRTNLFAKEGISCGISSGANVHAALQLAAREEMRGKRIVTFICDTGERYLS